MSGPLDPAKPIPITDPATWTQSDGVTGRPRHQLALGQWATISFVDDASPKQRNNIARPYMLYSAGSSPRGHASYCGDFKSLREAQIDAEMRARYRQDGVVFRYEQQHADVAD